MNSFIAFGQVYFINKLIILSSKHSMERCEPENLHMNMVEKNNLRLIKLANSACTTNKIIVCCAKNNTYWHFWAKEKVWPKTHTESERHRERVLHRMKLSHWIYCVVIYHRNVQKWIVSIFHTYTVTFIHYGCWLSGAIQIEINTKQINSKQTSQTMCQQRGVLFFFHFKIHSDNLWNL